MKPGVVVKPPLRRISCSTLYRVVLNETGRLYSERDTVKVLQYPLSGRTK